jgi:hypothetical protein
MVKGVQEMTDAPSRNRRNRCRRHACLHQALPVGGTALKRTTRFAKPTAPLGWLYVVSHPNAPGQVKIGITERPVTRMQELGKPIILARVPVMKPRDKEQLLFNRFAPQRVPQTEYFQLDQQQLEFVLNSCTLWMEEVQRLIVEPHVPEDVQVNPKVVRAQPVNGIPMPGEDLREFIQRPARERREALARMKERQAEMLDFQRGWREHLKSEGFQMPEGVEEREQREREEYQAWVTAVEESLKPPEFYVTQAGSTAAPPLHRQLRRCISWWNTISNQLKGL